MSKTILIIHNAISDNPGSDELDVLEQAGLVKKALLELGYLVSVMPVDFNLEKTISEIRRIRPHVVFNLAETLYNRSEFAFVAPSVLGYLNVPFTGSPVIPMFYASNKVLTKQELTRNGIPTPGWLSLAEIRKADPGKKYILKPTWEEGSLGLDEDNIFTGSDKKKDRPLCETEPGLLFCRGVHRREGVQHLHHREQEQAGSAPSRRNDVPRFPGRETADHGLYGKMEGRIV